MAKKGAKASRASAVKKSSKTRVRIGERKAQRGAAPRRALGKSTPVRVETRAQLAPSASSNGRRESKSAAAPPVSVKPVVAKSIATMPTAKKPRRDKIKEPPKPLVPLPPPPVTTDSKPKKNQAGLSVRELDTFRNLLLAKRRELLGDMSSMEREALQSGQGSNLSNLPVHMADMGTDNYEQEFTLGLVEKDRQLLREINHALAKIQDGTYGICEGTGKPINKLRLEIQPWTRFSIEHARALEKNMMLRR